MITEEEKTQIIEEERKRNFQLEREREIELGKLIPPAFLGALADQAERALWNWFKANNAPIEVSEMLDNIIVMERHTSTLEEGGNLGWWDYQGLTNDIVNMAKLIEKLGGEFHGADSSYSGCEPGIKWSADESSPEDEQSKPEEREPEKQEPEYLKEIKAEIEKFSYGQLRAIYKRMRELEQLTPRDSSLKSEL